MNDIDDNIKINNNHRDGNDEASMVKIMTSSLGFLLFRLQILVNDTNNNNINSNDDPTT